MLYFEAKVVELESKIVTIETRSKVKLNLYNPGKFFEQKDIGKSKRIYMITSAAQRIRIIKSRKAQIQRIIPPDPDFPVNCIAATGKMMHAKKGISGFELIVDAGFGPFVLRVPANIMIEKPQKGFLISFKTQRLEIEK